jgi:hypothetical protein
MDSIVEELASLKRRMDFLENLQAKSDFDLLVTALADIKTFVSDAAYIHPTDTIFGKTNEFISQNVTQKIQEKLSTHQNFMTVLTAVFSSNQTNGCALSLLASNNDEYLKQIAKFVGIPKGEELRLLRCASKNLDVMGFH